MKKRKKQVGRPAGSKPRWPFPNEVTMTAHVCGQWCKKVKGHLFYFGPTNDPQAALLRWESQKVDLRAGRMPQGVQAAGRATVASVCFAFMEFTQRRVTSGENTARTFNRYDRICKVVMQQLGSDKLIKKLGPSDFDILRAYLGEEFAPSTIQQMVTMIRKIFNHAWETERILNQVRFGAEFKAPTNTVIRKSQRTAARRNTFDQYEIKVLIHGHGCIGEKYMTQLRAMVFLGINCRFGLTDCAKLREHQVRIESPLGAHINFPRPKTGIERFCPLWPETVDALKAVSAERVAASDDVQEFFTAEDGLSWMTMTQKKRRGETKFKHLDRISRRFRLLKEGLTKMKMLSKDAPGFYKLRHTFRTIADEQEDPNGAARIMGHQLPGMSAVYVNRVSMKRLVKLSDHVHDWLFQL